MIINPAFKEILVKIISSCFTYKEYISILKNKNQCRPTSCDQLKAAMQWNRYDENGPYNH